MLWKSNVTLLNFSMNFNVRKISPAEEKESSIITVSGSKSKVLPPIQKVAADFNLIPPSLLGTQ